MVTLTADTKKLEDVARELLTYPAQAGKLLLAVGKTGERHVLSQLPKLLPQVFGVDAAPAKQALRRRRVRTVYNRDSQQIAIEIAGRPFTLTRFAHSPVRPQLAGKRYKVRAVIYNNRGVQQLRPLVGSDGKLKPVFLAPTLGGYLLFRRTGVFQGARKRVFSVAGGRQVAFRAKAEKLEVLGSLSVPQMITAKQVSDPLMKSLARSIDRKLSSELNKLGGNKA